MVRAGMISLSLDLTLFLLMQLVLQLSAASSTSGGSCGGSVLVTATNQTWGVELRVYHSASRPDDTPSFTLRELKGDFLSSECGELFEKCQTLLVVDVNSSGNNSGSSAQQQRSIVAIPLSNALGLLALDFTPDVKEEVHIARYNFDCSPGTVHHVRDSYYTLCSNSETGLVNLIELKLNTTHLSESYLSNLEHLHQASVYNLTNSIYVQLPSKSGDLIFFGTDQSIFSFKPLDYLIDELDVPLDEVGCFVTELRYIGGWNMVAYCENNQAMYIDINRESFYIKVDFAKDGRPYVCPNPDVYVTVHSATEHIEYGFLSTAEAKDFEVSMGVYDNGVCLGSEDMTLFVFADRERGTRLLNATGGFIESLSDSTCINYPCRPLVALENGLLVLREKRQGDWHISLFDSRDNFSLVRDVPHVRADLLATVGRCVLPTDSSGSVLTVIPTTSPVPRSRSHSSTRPHSSAPLIASIIVPVVAFFAICGVGAVFVFCMLRKGKGRRVLKFFSPGTEIGFEQRRHVDQRLVSGVATEETVPGGVFETDVNKAGNPAYVVGSVSQGNEGKGVQESGGVLQKVGGEEMVINNLDSNSDVEPLLN